VLGFTLIEILVITGILTIFAGMSLIFTFDAYRGNLFRSELTAVTNILQKARNEAVNNVGQEPHGVHFEAGEYTLFSGDPYVSSDPENIDILSNSEVSVGPVPHTVIFDQLTGNVDPSMTGNITIAYGSRVITIEINEQGRISW